MPQSLSAVYIHLTFSTKDRRRFLRDKVVRDKFHAQMGGISKTLECPSLIVGGMEDHVHLLCRFGRTVTQAEWVKELKRVSNGWLKEQGPYYTDFEWQGGYADFSVSHSNLEQVKRNPGLEDAIPLGLKNECKMQVIWFWSVAQDCALLVLDL